MTKPIPVTYEGTTYPSTAALARAFGITNTMAKIRLKNGQPMDAPKMSASEAGRMGRKASGWGVGEEFLYGEKL